MQEVSALHVCSCNAYQKDTIELSSLRFHRAVLYIKERVC